MPKAQCWNKLWKLQVPPKVKLFIWRAFNGILPTMLSLKSGGVNCDMLCPRCKGGTEMISRALSWSVRLPNKLGDCLEESVRLPKKFGDCLDFDMLLKGGWMFLLLTFLDYWHLCAI